MVCWNCLLASFGAPRSTGDYSLFFVWTPSLPLPPHILVISLASSVRESGHRVAPEPTFVPALGLSAFSPKCWGLGFRVQETTRISSYRSRLGSWSAFKCLKSIPALPPMPWSNQFKTEKGKRKRKKKRGKEKKEEKRKEKRKEKEKVKEKEKRKRKKKRPERGTLRDGSKNWIFIHKGVRNR